MGELAPSIITFALIFSALLEVITPPTAAGIKTSQSTSRISPSYSSPPEKPLTEGFLAICLKSSGILRPSLFITAPPKSFTATTFAPLSYESRAAYLPTFPNP